MCIGNPTSGKKVLYGSDNALDDDIHFCIDGVCAELDCQLVKPHDYQSLMLLHIA